MANMAQDLITDKKLKKEVGFYIAYAEYDYIDQCIKEDENFEDLISDLEASRITIEKERLEAEQYRQERTFTESPIRKFWGILWLCACSFCFRPIFFSRLPILSLSFLRSCSISFILGLACPYL